MSATVLEIYQAIDAMAPFSLAVPEDNVGILVGNPGQAVDTVLVALDASTPVVEEARDLGAQLIVTHHPVLFRPVQRIVYGDPYTELIYRMAANGLSMIAAHTNLDRARGGINDELAARLGWEVSYFGDFIRAGVLPMGLDAAALIDHVCRRIGGRPILTGPDHGPLRRFAICGGSGGSELMEAKQAQADVLITGELKHSEVLAAWEMGLGVLTLGHGASEICAVDLLQKHLQNASDALQWNMRVNVSTWKLLV